MLRVLTAALVLAAGGGIAAAASLPSGQDKAAALQRLASVATTDSNTVPAAHTAPPPQPIPARMLGSAAPVPVPPSILRVKSGWLVSDGRTLVAVYAGAAGHNPSLGRLVIVRQNLGAGRQTVRTLDARGTGALTVAAPSLGSAAEPLAQLGRIRLRTAGGRALRLDRRARTLTGAS